MAKEKNVVFQCVEYASISEAGKAAGFEVQVPAYCKEVEPKRVAVIAGKIVEVVYPNHLIYRVAQGAEDISGDYTAYQEENQCKIGNFKVTEKGYYGRVFLALWTDGKMTYSFHTPYGAVPEMFTDFITTLEPVESTDNVELPCPIVEYPYIFEAEYAVGFGVLVPNALSIMALEHIYVIGGDMVELVYHNGVQYRMAHMEGDISGDYAQYACQEKFDVVSEMGTFHVTAKGNKNLYYVAYWNCGEIAGSISVSHGVHRETLEKLVKSLGLID